VLGWHIFSVVSWPTARDPLIRWMLVSSFRYLLRIKAVEDVGDERLITVSLLGSSQSFRLFARPASDRMNVGAEKRGAGR
jgi:hypothetical protein